MPYIRTKINPVHVQKYKTVKVNAGHILANLHRTSDRLMASIVRRKFDLIQDIDNIHQNKIPTFQEKICDLSTIS